MTKVQLIAGLLFLQLMTAPGPHLLAANKAEHVEFFEQRIRPVLAQDCYECHSSKGGAEGGLVLDHRQGLLEGGDRGPAIAPGKPDESLLIQVIRHDVEDVEMPSAAPKLDAVIIRDFEQWVRMGAPDPRDEPPTDSELAADTEWSAVMERRKSWWSFQLIGDPHSASNQCRQSSGRSIHSTSPCLYHAPAGEAR